MLKDCPRSSHDECAYVAIGVYLVAVKERFGRCASGRPELCSDLL